MLHRKIFEALGSIGRSLVNVICIPHLGPSISFLSCCSFKTNNRASKATFHLEYRPESSDTMMSSIEWEKYEKKWCVTRTSGAIHIRPSPWKVEGQNLFSLSECQQECAKDHTCEGIVIKRGMEARGPCYMRTTLQPDRCKKSSGHDLYYIRRGIE